MCAPEISLSSHVYRGFLAQIIESLPCFGELHNAIVISAGVFVNVMDWWWEPDERWSIITTARRKQRKPDARIDTTLVAVHML